MRVGPAKFLAAAVVAAMLLPGSAPAADIQQSTEITPQPAGLIREYVERRALLHIIRATFDVEAVDDLPLLVAGDRDAAETSGVTEEAIARLNTALIAEGSYFIVSLEYLIKAGYPAWPEDRPPDTYVNDALALLQPLPAELAASVGSGEDPIAVLQAAAQVYRWTEGEQDDVAPTGKADFDARDTLVDAAFAVPAAETIGL